MYFLILALFAALHPVLMLAISPQEVDKIAEKVWRNECRGTLDGLTTWNKGESFGSFGIGHFIWYTKGKPERFQESFPELLAFLQSSGTILPNWLKSSQTCPWSSREEFYANFNSPEMNALRQLLFDTRNLQAVFIAQRLEKALPKILVKVSENEKPVIMSIYSRLASDPRGLYIIIDYLNFKGEGTSPSEGYKGQGWGLLQVLQRLQPSSNNIVEDFIQAAKAVLTKRVENSPPDRNEKQWLPGWINRINTYGEPP